MKLLNHTLLFLSLILFTTVGLWAFLFNSQLLRQVKTTIDKGLENYKIVIIDKLKDDSVVIEQEVFLDNNYIVKSVSEDYALQVRDTYKDTLIFSNLKNTSYQVRLLTTAFIAADGNYYEMKIISNELDKGELVSKIIISLLWLFLFLFVGTLLVNNFVLKNTWKPFYEVLIYLNDFRLDKSTYRELSETRIQEFSLLNESIQNLLKTNVDIYNSQKQFIENASHEFQTPLAIGINKLELLAGDDNLHAEQTEKIGEIIEAFQRISGLNKSLLLLSKIENKQFSSEELVNFDEIFCKIIHDFLDFSDFQKIKIKYFKEDTCLYKMNKDLAEILAMNLVKNAIIHNQQGGELIIRMESRSFTVENPSDGPKISTDKLFKRFNKSSNKKGSTGLGLAIVKAITDVVGLSISYTYCNRHIFKVSKADKIFSSIL
ncbi:MAG: HAMP domain-containing histidine kinase [Flammeovirgaceae bacterium]|nr:HAMP domain-containing histidine kinase [Flammeovirgaceae bacterium]